VQIALANNPDLQAAQEQSKAAGFDTKAAGASRLPKLSLFATGDYYNYVNSLKFAENNQVVSVQPYTTAQAGVRATIPLFQGGLPAAQIRQAQAREGAALEQEIGVERQVIATVRAAYSSWKAANDVITMNQTAVDAAALSLKACARKHRGQPHDSRHPQRRTGTAQRAGPARYRAAQRLSPASTCCPPWARRTRIWGWTAALTIPKSTTTGSGTTYGTGHTIPHLSPNPHAPLTHRPRMRQFCSDCSVTAGSERLFQGAKRRCGRLVNLRSRKYSNRSRR
jgi:hypothetical protein